MLNRLIKSKNGSFIINCWSYVGSACIRARKAETAEMPHTLMRKKALRVMLLIGCKKLWLSHDQLKRRLCLGYTYLERLIKHLAGGKL